MNPPNPLSVLRQLVLEPGTSERWWEAIELATAAEDHESLLVDFLMSHVSHDQRWWGCRVPRGDWGPEHPAHNYCKVETREIETLPGAIEIYCPPGTFSMGAADNDEGAASHEKPARAVTLTRGFWALSTPVTEAMYGVFHSYIERTGRGPRYPMASEWSYGLGFCLRLNEAMGLSSPFVLNQWPSLEDTLTFLDYLPEEEGFRLPTEAEWEYLCRAGSSGTRYGPLEEIAWTREDGLEGMQPVGSKAPNAWGFLDTLGNVSEWCLDSWEENATTELEAEDPCFVSQSYDEAVIRGGAWDLPGSDARASHRSRLWFDSLGSQAGFRTVRRA